MSILWWSFALLVSSIALFFVLRWCLPYLAQLFLMKMLRRARNREDVSSTPFVSKCAADGRWTFFDRLKLNLYRSVMDLSGNRCTLPSESLSCVSCDLDVPAKDFLAACFRHSDAGCDQCAVADEVGCAPDSNSIAFNINQNNQSPVSSIPVRAYVNQQLHREAPILIYFHGGGWVTGSPRSHDNICSALCTRTGACVISVDYRRSPEHLFPAANDDCLAVLEYCHQNAELLAKRISKQLPSTPLTLNKNAIILAGDSAGGQLCLVTMLYSRDHNMPAFNAVRAVVPIYPTSDCLTSFPSAREFGETGAILRQSDMHFYRRTFLGSTIAESLEIGVAVDSVPLIQETVTALTAALTARPGTPKSERRRTDTEALAVPLNLWRSNRLAIAQQLTQKISLRVWKLSNCVYWSPAIHPMFDSDTKFSADDVAVSLPATLLVSAELDVLRDESILMAARIQTFVERTRRLSLQPSAPVRIHMMPQAPHGFISGFVTAPDWSSQVDVIAAFILDRIQA